MKQAKGYTGARSRTLRAAKEQVMHAGADAFTHRKDKKADRQERKDLRSKQKEFAKIRKEKEQK